MLSFQSFCSKRRTPVSLFACGFPSNTTTYFRGCFKGTPAIGVALKGSPSYFQGLLYKASGSPPNRSPQKKKRKEQNIQSYRKKGGETTAPNAPPEKRGGGAKRATRKQPPKKKASGAGAGGQGRTPGGAAQGLRRPGPRKAPGPRSGTAERRWMAGLASMARWDGKAKSRKSAPRTETRVETRRFVGICRGIKSFQGSLGGAKLDFATIHSRD